MLWNSIKAYIGGELELTQIQEELGIPATQENWSFRVDGGSRTVLPPFKSISRKKGYCLKSTKPLIYHLERVSVMFVKPNCKTLTFQNCNSVTLESSHRLAETGSKPAGKGINSGTVICLTATHEFTPRRKLQFDTYLRFFKVPTQNETSWSADL